MEICFFTIAYFHCCIWNKPNMKVHKSWRNIKCCHCFHFTGCDETLTGWLYGVLFESQKPEVLHISHKFWGLLIIRNQKKLNCFHFQFNSIMIYLSCNKHDICCPWVSTAVKIYSLDNSAIWTPNLSAEFVFV